MVKTVQRPATIEMTTSFRKPIGFFYKYQTIRQGKRSYTYPEEKTVMKL
jgi:hypothetical protein